MNLTRMASASVKIIFDTVSGWRQAGHPMREFEIMRSPAKGTLFRDDEMIALVRACGNAAKIGSNPRQAADRLSEDGQARDPLRHRDHRAARHCMNIRSRSTIHGGSQSPANHAPRRRGGVAARPTATRARPCRKSKVDHDQRYRHFGTLSRVHRRIDGGSSGKCRWPGTPWSARKGSRCRQKHPDYSESGYFLAV